MEIMRQGDCLRLTSFEYVSENGTRLRYKMPRDKVVLAVIVGEEKKLPQKQEDMLDVKEAVKKTYEGGRDAISAELTGITGKMRI